MRISDACLGIAMAQGIAETWGGSSVLMVGADVGTGVGGIGQSFLISNKFSETDPVLGQGVLCLTEAQGMSSSDEGLNLSFWVIVTLGNIYQQILPICVPTCGPTSEPTYCPAVGQPVF